MMMEVVVAYLCRDVALIFLKSQYLVFLHDGIIYMSSQVSSHNI